MIEVRQIRMGADAAGKLKKSETALSPVVKVASVAELLNNAEKHVAHIPESERYNLYFTLGHGILDHTGTGRTWAMQDVITFDVDHIEYEDIFDDVTGKTIARPLAQYTALVTNALGLVDGDYGLIATGYGLQLIIPLAKPIEDKRFFKQNALHYQMCMQKISQVLTDAKLPHEMDATAFESNRLHRMPATINRKAGRPDRHATLLVQVPEKASNWDLAKTSGLPAVKETDELPAKQVSRLSVDVKEVQTCNFLKWAKENQNDVTEPQWYAMLSVVSRLDDTGAHAHEYSKDYKGYSPREVDRKVEYAKTIAGPRTCDNINNLWGQCASCPHYRQVNSPISIKGKDFIATKDAGFWFYDKNGKPTNPDYEGLLKQYQLDTNFVNIKDEIFVYEESHFKKVDDRHPQQFTETMMNPKPMRVHRGEFQAKVSMYNIAYEADGIRKSASRKINFKNGVLDLETMQLLDHSPEYFFTHTLTYDYDPIAQAPMFEKFLDDVTKGRAELKQALIEYIGYCMSGDECRAHKFLTLTGTGANGKSTLVQILQALAGGMEGKAFSSVRLDSLGNNFDNMGLFNKLFNIMDENEPYLEGKQFEILKDMVAGGVVTGANKFKDAIQFVNKTKFIMLCNELPKGAAPNKGYFRRLLIVPFDAEFEGKGADAFIADKICESELPGIMNLALEGYHNLKARGYKFAHSDVMDKALENYKHEADNVARWASFYVEAARDTKQVYSITDLRGRYEEWTRLEGERAVATNQFTKRLQAYLKAKNIKFTYYPQKWIANKNVSAIDGIEILMESSH